MKKKSSYFKDLSRKEYIIVASKIEDEEGENAISIRRLAAELNCSTTILYKYFENLDELLFYVKLKYLNYYIEEIRKNEKNWEDILDKHLGIWECYSRVAFKYPSAFNTIFFSDMSKKLPLALREYYEMFPEYINKVTPYFHHMLEKPGFFERDMTMCQKCVEEGVISTEDAITMNKMVGMLYIAYLKEILDNGIEENEIEDRVNEFMSEVKVIISMFLKDNLGHKDLIFENANKLLCSLRKDNRIK